jgi:hypothetical protein
MERKLLLVLGACMAMSLSACSFGFSGNYSAGAKSSVSSDDGNRGQSSSSALSLTPEVAAAAAAVKDEYKVEPFNQYKNETGEVMPYVVSSAETTDGKDQYQLYGGVIRRVPVQLTSNYYIATTAANFTIQYSTTDYLQYVVNEDASTSKKYTHIWSTRPSGTAYATDTNGKSNYHVSISAVGTVGYVGAGGAASSGKADYSSIVSNRSNSWSYGNGSSGYHTYQSFSQVIQEYPLPSNIEFTLSEAAPGVYRYGTFVDCDLYYYAQVHVKNSVLVVDDLSAQLSPILASTVQGLDYTSDLALKDKTDWYSFLVTPRFDVTESYLWNLDYFIQTKYETFPIPVEVASNEYFDFRDDGKGNLILYKLGSTGRVLSEIRVPDVVNGKQVVAIDEDAFYNDQAIRYVYLPTSVVDIRNGAFKGCSKLIRVDIAGKVTNFGDEAFANCPYLRFLNVPSSLISMGYGVFTNTLRLPFLFEDTKCYLGDTDNPHFILVNASTGGTAFDISPDTKLIAGGAFEDCSSTKTLDLTLPDGLIFVGSHAFENCSLRSVVLPSSMTSISDDCFKNCSALESITIPSSITSIGMDVFWSCFSLASISIPASVTLIGAGAFGGCSGLTKSEFASIESLCAIYFGDGIGNPLYWTNHLYIHGNETEVKELVVPSSVASIGAHAFEGCSGLTSVSIPSSVTSIGYQAFKDCNKLIKAEFASIESLCTMDFGSQASNPLIYANHLYFHGNEAEVTEVVMPSSVTSIPSFAFAGDSGLCSVTIPSSVTSIGGYAFYYCSDLDSVTIPSSVTSIANYTFYDCLDLGSLTIPSSVTTIGNYAFVGCLHLDSLIIPSSVTSIGDGAFGDCISMSSLIIPSSVTSIGKNAFTGCENAKIYCQATLMPSNWDEDWNGTSMDKGGTVYWYSETSKAGCWHYVSGVPTLW